MHVLVIIVNIDNMHGEKLKKKNFILSLTTLYFLCHFVYDVADFVISEILFFYAFLAFHDSR